MPRAKREERIVGRRGAIIVEPQNHAGEMRAVRPRAAELIIGHIESGTAVVEQVLQLTAAAVVAEDDV